MQRIELRHVTKRFGKTVAVDDVSLTIEPGSFLTILGPSGCGKTTILRMIAGLEEPDAGEILIDGRPVFSRAESIFVPAAERGLGMVFQSYALWPHMTVYQNVAFGLEMARMPKAQIRQRVSEILADLQMAGMEDRYPQELSGGQQQRVALARMLAPKPSIFLLDEPLSNLDARLRMDMRSELKRLHRDTHATAVYVTHDQLEALTMSTHVAVMCAGRLQQLASPDEVYRYPANLFVADFIGSPKVNLLEGYARPAAGGTRVDLGTFSLEALPVWAEGAVVAAIRPEDVQLSTEPVAGGVEFSVYSVLPAGSEAIVNVRCRETMLTVKVGRGTRVDMDQTVWLIFDPRSINLYDKASGLLIAA